MPVEETAPWLEAWCVGSGNAWGRLFHECFIKLLTFTPGEAGESVSNQPRLEATTKVLAGLPALVGGVCLTSTMCSARSSYSVTDQGALNTINRRSYWRSWHDQHQRQRSIPLQQRQVSNPGTLRGTSGIGDAINASGQIAGYSQTPTTFTGDNDSGAIVGRSTFSNTYHAFFL
jgi:hypothetical protein